MIPYVCGMLNLMHTARFPLIGNKLDTISLYCAPG